MKMLKLTQAILLSLSMAMTLTACNDDDDDNNTTPSGNNTENTDTNFELKIVHINDHHSHLEAEGESLTIDGVETDVEMGGFPRVVAKINDLREGNDNVLALHAGDAITGTLYYTLFKGEADADLMNQVCFDAFALGNHEFDDGDDGLKNFLSYLNGSSICETPILGANIVPEVGVSPLALFSATDYIQPYIIKEVNGEQVGIIGIDIATKTKNSSSPDETTEFLDEITTAQKYIDELTAQGVNKIIVMTHYQYANDLAMSEALKGVDVIVGGDSHTLLGESFADYGLNPAGPYPTNKTNADGNPVCVVQAWQYSNVVGELNVTFDADGNVTECAGTPHLLIGDTFERDDAELTGADKDAFLATLDGISEISVVTPDTASSDILASYSAEAEVLSAASIGTVAEDLCLERIPGQGKSSLCDVTATEAQGSDISNIVALAFKTMSLTSDIAIQNAGGVRTDIAAGDITVGDAYTLLPFANTLVEIDMTGQQIVDVLEEAYAYAISPDGSTGAYPYASGMRWDLDGSQVQGARFSNVEVMLKDETVWSPIDLTKNYKVVTNSFISGGRDGYLTFGNIADESKVDTYLDYAQSFVDYVQTVGTVTKLPADEYSTQSYTAPVAE